LHKHSKVIFRERAKNFFRPVLQVIVSPKWPPKVKRIG
jgi:hypothetical protein